MVKFAYTLDFISKALSKVSGSLSQWIVRVTVGKLYLKRRMKAGRMKAGGSTVPKSIPPDDLDETKAIEKTIGYLERLSSAEKLYPSPLLGELTLKQWQTMHVGHTAHHLGFLSPKGQ